MKDRAKTAMVYYYDQKEKQIELMTVLRTIGSGYPIQMNDGKSKYSIKVDLSSLFFMLSFTVFLPSVFSIV